LVHSDFLLFLTVAQIVIDFSFQIKGKNDLSHKSNKGIWHSLCFAIVSGFGLPKSINYQISDKSLAILLFVLYLCNVQLIFDIKNPRCITATGFVFITISPVRILPSGVFVPIALPLRVARLANRAPCLWGHQNAATGAVETLRSIFADNGATAAFVTATRIIFAHSGFCFVVNYALNLTHFLSESKRKRDSSHKSNKDTWHGPCFPIVSGFGQPKSKNYEKTLLYYNRAVVLLFHEKYLIVEVFT
jgi:hypothetical protein